MKLIKADLAARSSPLVIADMGCGEAELARDLSSKHKFHSFDLVAANKFITACDITHVPLPKEAVDAVVFCLALMGTNLDDFIREARRILKNGGELIIAEVESRVKNREDFNRWIESHGFQRIKSTNKDQSIPKMFILEKYKKINDHASKKKNPNSFRLQPCLYKKR